MWRHKFKTPAKKSLKTEFSTTKLPSSALTRHILPIRTFSLVQSSNVAYRSCCRGLWNIIRFHQWFGQRFWQQARLGYKWYYLFICHWLRRAKNSAFLTQTECCLHFHPSRQLCIPWASSRSPSKLASFASIFPGNWRKKCDILIVPARRDVTDGGWSSGLCIICLALPILLKN